MSDGTKDFPTPYSYSGAISDSLQIRNALKIASVTLNSFLSSLMLS
jgi:hypothetical protein